MNPLPKHNNPTIVIDARYLGKPGMGIHVYVKQIINIMLANDINPILLLDKEIKLPQQYKKLQYVVLRSHFKLFWEQVALPLYLRKVNYDVFFAPANIGLPLFYKKGSHRFVLNIHDLIPIHFPRNYTRRPIFLLNYFISIAISVKKADMIVADSRFTAKDIEKVFNKPAYPKYISYDFLKNTLVRPSNSVAPKQKYFICNGGLDPRKNIRSLILGFNIFNKKHLDYKLLVFGGGCDKLRQYVYHKNINNIIFTGYISEKEKFNLISQSLAFIYPSSMEGFGIPILEAFFCKTLVVCAKNSSLPEVAGDGAYYLKNINPKSISNSLGGIIKLNQAMRKTLIENGQKQIKFFSDKNINDSYVDIFDNL